jgi:hypothetical protein
VNFPRVLLTKIVFFAGVLFQLFTKNDVVFAGGVLFHFCFQKDFRCDGVLF